MPIKISKIANLAKIKLLVAPNPNLDYLAEEIM